VVERMGRICNKVEDIINECKILNGKPHIKVYVFKSFPRHLSKIRIIHIKAEIEKRLSQQRF
jgi:hypothetical protein